MKNLSFTSLTHGTNQPGPLRRLMFSSRFSFSMGVLALLVVTAKHNPARAIPLLKIGALGKGLYAVIGYYTFATEGLHWFYLVFVGWDAAFVVVFCLYWVALESADLLTLHRDVLTGIERPTTNKALIVGYTLTNSGREAIDRLRQGLLNGGYDEVDLQFIKPREALYDAPLTFWRFVQILVRAALRKSPRIAPVPAAPRTYDLVVVESPTWLLGIAGPVEGFFEDEANAALLKATDTAAIVVCRGAYRRSLAMLARWLERRGANVVGVRGYEHQGWEPRRLISLWLYLIFNRPGFPRGIAQPDYGLSEASLKEVEAFGEALAGRDRTRPPLTLLAPEGTP